MSSEWVVVLSWSDMNAVLIAPPPVADRAPVVQQRPPRVGNRFSKRSPTAEASRAAVQPPLTTGVIHSRVPVRKTSSAMRLPVVVLSAARELSIHGCMLRCP